MGLWFCSPLNILQGDIQGSLSKVAWPDRSVKGEPAALLLPGSGLQRLSKTSLALLYPPEMLSLLLPGIGWLFGGNFPPKLKESLGTLILA